MFTEILGYFLGLLVGLLLGMLGGGGSLLLPVMLYLLHKDISRATAYTTLLVGVAAGFGAIPRWKSNEIDWPVVFALGIPVSVGMLLTRGLLFDIVPDQLFQIGAFVVTKKIFVLTIFAGILLVSFATMSGWIGNNLKPDIELRQRNPTQYYTILLVCGLLIGVIPGFTGAGGGVLIVPLMVVLFGTPMRTIVGTSLTIVVAKSFIGFFGGDLFRLGSQIEWNFLMKFSIVMMIGAVLGSQIASRVDENRLKKIFAWFMLCLALFILAKETLIAMQA